MLRVFITVLAVATADAAAEPATTSQSPRFFLEAQSGVGWIGGTVERNPSTSSDAVGITRSAFGITIPAGSLEISFGPEFDFYYALTSKKNAYSIGGKLAVAYRVAPCWRVSLRAAFASSWRLGRGESTEVFHLMSYGTLGGGGLHAEYRYGLTFGVDAFLVRGDRQGIASSGTGVVGSVGLQGFRYGWRLPAVLGWLAATAVFIGVATRYSSGPYE